MFVLLCHCHIAEMYVIIYIYFFSGRIYLCILVRPNNGELCPLLPGNRGMWWQQWWIAGDADVNQTGIWMCHAGQAGHPSHLDHSAKGEMFFFCFCTQFINACEGVRLCLSIWIFPQTAERISVKFVAGGDLQ